MPSLGKRLVSEALSKVKYVVEKPLHSTANGKRLGAVEVKSFTDKTEAERFARQMTEETGEPHSVIPYGPSDKRDSLFSVRTRIDEDPY